ncbi:MAG TPA: efflux transporter periplasmic adaptor subunit [Gammaproteobacteria bacterium]|nr:efflux transporter periplasmic adaptor subunit [Gammaproteobacteria bacterium]
MRYHRSKYWLILLTALTAAPTGFAAEADSSLTVVSVVSQTIDKEYVVDGVVEPIKRALITAQTSGQVLEVNFDIDDFVKKGSTLVHLKSIEQKSSLEQVNAQVVEAKAHLNAAHKEYNRIKQLRTKRVASAAQFDKADADLKAAKARVKAAVAQVTQASQQVQYTTITAPYSGIVIERHIEPGEIALPGQPIMSGFSMSGLRVVAKVPQSQIEAVRQYKKTQVILESYSKTRRFKSKKLTIAPYADAQTHTFKVRVDLPKKAPDVYPGMFTKVAFVVGQEQRLMIPTKTVVYRGEVRAVYVVDKAGQISMRQVRLGREHAEQIEILAGLEAGEQIATKPVDATILLKAQRDAIKKPVLKAH